MSDSRETVCSPEAIRTLQLLDARGPTRRSALIDAMPGYDPTEAIEYLNGFGLIAAARDPRTGNPMRDAFAITTVGMGVMQTELRYATAECTRRIAEFEAIAKMNKASDEDREACKAEILRWRTMLEALRSHKPSRVFHPGELAPPPEDPVAADDADGDDEPDAPPPAPAGPLGPKSKPRPKRFSA